MTERLKAPYPYFGGKSTVASIVWSRLGNPDNFVEPFFGSGAVLLARPGLPRIETVNDLDCVAPSTLILRGDLSWVPAAEVKVGDPVVGFDESNGPAREGFRAPTRYRRWQHATVTGVRRLMKPCYRLTFSDGTTVISSADHLWLGGSHGKSGGRGWRWQKTESLVCNRRTQRSWILKLVSVKSREESHDAGWLAGLYDREGHLTGGPGWRIVLSQKRGPVLDRAIRLLQDRGFTTRVSVGARGVGRLEVKGGMRETLRLLMTIRPERLIAKVAKMLPNVSLYGRDHAAVGLVEKEFLGDREVVAIETDCHTFVAEGLASHNCYVANFWRATQADPEAVVDHADGPVNEADLHARHRWLVLSDDAKTFRQLMRTDPGYFDARIAGWWCWGLCCWIGSGWCASREELERKEGSTPALAGSSGRGQGVVLNGRGNAAGEPRCVQRGPDQRKPRIDGGEGQYGHGIHAGGRVPGLKEKRPQQCGNGQSSGIHANTEVLIQAMPDMSGRGIHSSGIERKIQGRNSATWEQVPYVDRGNGRGVNQDISDTNRPQLADAYSRGRGVNGNDDAGTCAQRRAWLLDWFNRLRDRLRTVRVCCGDWLRVCDSDSVTTRLGLTGIFFDPPYGAKAGRNMKLYSQDSGTVADDVRAYCLERGQLPGMRIALCGYAGEGHEVLEAAGWECVAWQSHGGYGNRSAKGKANAKKERMWFSPHCEREVSLW